jgi:hypothetical protein
LDLFKRCLYPGLRDQRLIETRGEGDLLAIAGSSFLQQRKTSWNESISRIENGNHLGPDIELLPFEEYWITV